MNDFLKNDFVRVFYDEATDALWVKYSSKVPDEKQFSVVVDAMLNGFRKLKTQKFIADLRKMGIMGTGSQKLVLEKLLPGMIEHLKGKTLYHAQLIDTGEIFGKVSANAVHTKSTGMKGMQMTQFSNETEMITFMNNIKTA